MLSVDGSVTADTPLRLSTAAELAFPGGGMKAAGLRKERDAGRLETWFVAGKEYTSLSAIEEMLKQCRARQKDRGSISSQKGAMPPEPLSIAQPGSSETETISVGLASLLMKCEQPRKLSANI